MSFCCLQIFQKINKKISRISALASKKRSNQKRSVRDAHAALADSQNTAMMTVKQKSYKENEMKSTLEYN